MADTPPPEPHHKLPPLAQGSKIQKRPLNKPQLAASSKHPVVYISSHTPFVSAVKRVRKQLTKSLRGTRAASKHSSLHSRVQSLQRSTNTAPAPAAAAAAAAAADANAASPTVVTVMGTGKAIEKTLSLASWFQQEGDCHVHVRTKTVVTVDDVIVEQGGDKSRVRRVSCLEVAISLK